jgi:predicted RNA-binding protein Jag
MTEEKQEHGEEQETAVDERAEADQPLRQPPGVDMYSATGRDVEALKQRLFKEAGGRELYYQEYDAEDGETTVFGYPRTAVMDLIYSIAYPVIKMIDDRAIIKVKSNRAVTEFFVIIHTRRSGTYIGQHGMTLDALENLINHSVSRVFPRWVTLCVDVDKYRQKRQAYLEGLIRRIIREIERDHRERPLQGLLPKERKYIHQFFSDHPYLTTESRGKKNDRTLFILPREDIREI